MQSSFKETGNPQVSVQNFAFHSNQKKTPNADLAGIGAVGGKGLGSSATKTRLQSNSPAQQQNGSTKFGDESGTAHTSDFKSRNPNGGKMSHENMRPNSSQN